MRKEIFLVAYLFCSSQQLIQKGVKIMRFFKICLEELSFCQNPFDNSNYEFC